MARRFYCLGCSSDQEMVQEQEPSLVWWPSSGRHLHRSQLGLSHSQFPAGSFIPARPLSGWMDGFRPLSLRWEIEYNSCLDRRKLQIPRTPEQPELAPSHPHSCRQIRLNISSASPDYSRLNYPSPRPCLNKEYHGGGTFSLQHPDPHSKCTVVQFSGRWTNVICSQL